MVVRCFTSKSVHNVSKNLLSNCVHFYVSIRAGVSYGTSQWLENIDETCGAMFLNEGIAQNSFVYWSAVTTMSWLSVVDFSRGPKKYFATTSGGGWRGTGSGGTSS